MCKCTKNIAFKKENKIIKAIETLRQKYGVSGLNNMYMIATDIDGDLRIAPFGLPDSILSEVGAVSANNFVKIKDLT